MFHRRHQNNQVFEAKDPFFPFEDLLDFAIPTQSYLFLVYKSFWTSLIKTHETKAFFLKQDNSFVIVTMLVESFTSFSIGAKNLLSFILRMSFGTI